MIRVEKVINLNQFENIEELIKALERIKEKSGNIKYKIEYGNIHYDESITKGVIR